MTCPPRLIRHCAGALVIITIAATVASCSIVKIKKNPSGPVTYYVSLSGNDSASGKTPATAWRTLSKVNATIIPPGSRILLHGGDRFAGWLRLGKQDAGSSAKPVTIGSYGSGVATIDARGESGITVFDTAGVDIRDLKLVGSGKTGDGIKAYSDLPAGRRLRHISISHVQVTGFRDGISVGGQHPAAGFADVQVTDSASYGNVDSGLLLFGPAYDAQSPTYANQDVLISRVAARDNLGDPAINATDSGNGIVLGSVSHALVAWSTATGNGGKGNAGQEGAGIWTYDSTGVTISHNLSYRNKTRNRIDGDGFDLDENSSDCVLENNLSYGNDGAGYLVYSPLDNGAETGNVIRNNISSDDVLDGSSGYGGITATGYVSGLKVYQNTVVTASAAAAKIGSFLRDTMLANNIFTTRSGPVLDAGDSRTGTFPAPAAVTFRGNDYYSAGAWQVRWGTRTYQSLAKWQASLPRATRGGRSAGYALAPRLTGPTLGLAAENPTDLAAARGFQLAPGSPLSGAGVDLAALGLADDPANFLGQARKERHPNVGAL